MCGLVVIQDNNSRIDRKLIPAIHQAMHHRGPDGNAYYYQPDLLMCHNRLAIEGEKEELQPLYSVDGQCIAVVNGELYPYQMLRQQLQQQGYHFQTQSDSELAIVLYQHYGLDFVHHLRGEFALVLWDKKRLSLIAVRDRFGIKPLLYGQEEVYGQDNASMKSGRWYLASEAKALFAAGFKAKWSRQGVAECFSHQYLLPGSSLFAGIKQLPPGHILIIKQGRAQLHCYWRMSFSHQSSSDNILDQLTQAVSIRIPSRQPCAFSLSGGLDSSAVVALAARELTYQPDCYCVSFDDNDYDEFQSAAQFAKRQGYRLHQVKVSRDDLVNYIDDAAFYSEGLAINGQYVGKFLLNKAIAADGYQVVMSGEGADEAFMGYAHLLNDYCCYELTGSERSTALAQLINSYPLQQGLMLADGAQNHESDQIIPSFLVAKFSFSLMFKELFKHDFCAEVNQLVIQKRLINNYTESLPASQLASLIWTELALANYILNTLGDGMEMAFSLEGRLPFLDHPLFESATGLATTHKLNKLTTKLVLRKSLANILPAEIIERKKHPFIAPPILQNLSKTTYEGIFDRLSTQTFKQNPVFDQKKVLKWINNWQLVSEVEQKRRDPILMMLLSFAALQSQFSLTDMEKH
ncbi:asparagine synthase (glutamine-hydrolyzing) [Spartinivicinus poritis]|uniref:asparagine synthase (glutamine-hydrolyzing) n=1 Tax=Spartinivicinus poritis TaxID=2994640 RepID=A0ABT5UE34_9GAMM|nr:asparagine synthase (glutamine-hydrolyzing) [Spartinivicinus sp. A2-2]MDE1463738.1 asparagine synthase (glutamine-hydrolyzing) [Spartinivicinus sp. A2-2]